VPEEKGEKVLRCDWYYYSTPTHVEFELRRRNEKGTLALNGRPHSTHIIIMAPTDK
jgi:hypothetical protein